MINTFLIVIMSVFLNSCREEDPYQGKCQNIPEVFFHYTGKLYKEGKYSGKFKDCMLDSTWTWYYDNGQKEQEMYFKNGVPIGKIYVWYSNGQLKTEYEGIGKRSGVELIYYPSGIKQYERTYKNDTLKKIVEFYENGVKKSYTEYLELGINNGKNEMKKEIKYQKHILYIIKYILTCVYGTPMASCVLLVIITKMVWKTGNG